MAEQSDEPKPVLGVPREVIQEMLGLQEIADQNELDLEYEDAGPDQLPHVLMLPKDPIKRAEVLADIAKLKKKLSQK